MPLRSCACWPSCWQPSPAPRSSPAFWADSRAHAIWALGLPVAVAVVPLLTAGTRFGVVVTWLAARVLIGWSLIFALGIGLFLLPAALAGPPPR